MNNTIAAILQMQGGITKRITIIIITTITVMIIIIYVTNDMFTQLTGKSDYYVTITS